MRREIKELMFNLLNLLNSYAFLFITNLNKAKHLQKSPTSF